MLIFYELLITQGLLLSAATALVFGVWMFLHKQRTAHDIAVAFVVTITAFWVFSFVLWRMTDLPAQALFWLKMLYLFGSFVPVSFLFYAITLRIGRTPPLLLQIPILLLNVVAYRFIFHTDLVIQGSAARMVATPDIGVVALALHFVVLILAALVVLLRAFARDHVGRHRSQLLMLAGSVAAFSSMFLVLYFFIPFFGEGYTAAGSIGVMIGVFLIAFAAFRVHATFDIKVFGVETLVFLGMFVLVTDTVSSSSNFTELSFRMVILVLLIVYGALMVRVLAQEMFRLHKIEAMYGTLTRLNGKLIESDRLKTKFVSFASHQLRAPIGGIRGYLDMMRKGDFGKVSVKQKNILGMNLEALERLTDTIQIFLDVTKIEFGKFELFKTKVSISELVQKVVNEMRPLAAKKKLTLELEVAHGISEIEVDAGKIHHALINLIDNAIKYTKRGFVRVHVSEDSGKLITHVTDTGMGMTKRDKERVFRLFERGISAVKLDASGEGLGLHIVKNIIEAHNGELIVESKGKGKGSRFGFSIPVINR